MKEHEYEHKQPADTEYSKSMQWLFHYLNHYIITYFFYRVIKMLSSLRRVILGSVMTLFYYRILQ